MKWKKNKYLCLTLVFAFGFFYSCEKETIKPIKVVTVSFKSDILPIFSGKCITCHGGSRNPDLRSDKAYISLTKGAYYDTIVPANSKIMTKLTTTHIDRANDVDRQKILLWITLGAKNN